jgi:zinc protease
MLTGRRIGMSFGIDEDAFVLGGQTNAADLGDQLRLLATKIAYPRWDPALFERFQTAALESFELHSASAASRASREFAGFARPGDARWRPVEREEMAAANVQQFETFFTPMLGSGPVHATIVGDTTLNAAIEAMRRTVGALPRRPDSATPADPGTVRPPAPNPSPQTFTHQGDPNQAYALIGWSTIGGIDRMRERRALALAANMFQVRLFDRLREVEGATYSPSASHSSSESFPNWGIFYAAAEVRPENTANFLRIGREIIADMAARPAAADEFQRAQNPVLSGLERRLATNAHWLGTIEDFGRRPQAIANARSLISDYRGLTAEEVRAAIAAHVTEAGDWSMLVLPARARP